MNFSELILSEDKIIVFVIVSVIAFILYYYFKGLIPNHVDIHPGVLVVLLYILFYVIDRMVVTNVHFNKPITNYILKKRNFREEPYHIKYINPFVTNLDKVDFNMKKRQNKEYVKNILSQLIIRKYIQFENVLGYLPNPWEIIKLEEIPSNSDYYKINDNEISVPPNNDDKIKDNMYCMNYLNDTNLSFLLLYRKHVLKFMNQQYFIFEKKNKKYSKYYLRECISQVVIRPNNEIYTIVDTRDLYYDRQYILFIGLPTNTNVSSDAFKKWKSPTSEYNTAKYKYYNKFRDDPVQYFWQNDGEIRDVIVLDIHFIYNQMLVLNEEIFNDDGSAQDFSLNKYYERNDWIEKKYFNFIKYQFSNRIGTATTSEEINTNTEKLQVFKSNNSNSVTNADATTIKFRKAIGKIKDYNTRFDGASFDLKLNDFKKSNDQYNTDKTRGKDPILAFESKAQADNYINKNLLNNRDYLKIKKIDGNDITIDFMKYIRNYIQNVPEKPANELVIVKNKKTKYSKDNDLILDQNTISYISFNFLNIKTIKEYRDKMNYIADGIMNKYYKKEVQSIDNIKYNLESLQIIQLDRLLRYDSGRKRLSLQGRTITPNNIGTYYKDIKKLREAYKNFLEQVLKYKKTLKEKIDSGNYSLNVTNNELLAIVNNNTFNVKSKYLGKISHIQIVNTILNYSIKENAEDTWDNTNKLNHEQTISPIYTASSSDKLIRLRIVDKTYKKPKKHPLFVKFLTTMNKNGFNINKDNIYIVHHLKVNDLLIPRYIYLEKFLLERDISNNEVKIIPPSQDDNRLQQSINIVDCTNSFRKETIGVSNLTRIIGKNKFKIIFDNTPLEFKPLSNDPDNTSSNIFIDRPNYVMLNFSKNSEINEIQNKIYENQLYKVTEIKSTSSTSSAELTLESLIDIDISNDDTRPELNDIYKDILVSQFINSKNYIENVYFKKVEVPKADRLLTDGPLYKFVVELKKQIINITPEITREDIIANYETTMTKIIDYIYENEAKKIHYEIPTNIGIYKDTSSAVYTYKYKNNLYITYDKRNGPVNLFKNYSSEYLCKKIYRGNNFAVNMNSLYYLDSYQEYYQYFINLFKNTLGLHDEINYQCNEYYKSGSMLSNLKLPITFNKYVTFQNNYMLYYKTNIRIDDVDKNLLGKHVVINNTICDNQLITVLNSNRMNSRLYKNFLKEFIYKHEIGRKGFEYDDAKKICERIFTVYDNNCPNQIYKKQSSDSSDYNLSYYKHNKERDTCFTTLYNDDKTKDTYQFIAESKLLDPTQDNVNDINSLQDNLKNITSLKYTCSAKLDENSCNNDPNCNYNNKTETCTNAISLDAIREQQEQGVFTPTYINRVDGYPLGYVTRIDIGKETFPGKNYSIDLTLNSMGNDLNFRGVGDAGVKMRLKDSTKTNLKELVLVDKKNKPEWIDRISSSDNLDSRRLNVYFNITMTDNNNSTRIVNKYSELHIKKTQYSVNEYYEFTTLEDNSFDNKFNFKETELSNLIIYPYEFTLIYFATPLKINDLPTNYFTAVQDDILSEGQGGEKRKLSGSWNSVTTHNNDRYMYKVVAKANNTITINSLVLITNDEADNLNKIIKADKERFNKEMTKYEKENAIDNANSIKNYKSFVKSIEDMGNLKFFPHRLAHLNEIKTAAYYGADWDDIGWINDANPQLYNKSNLVKIQDKKVMWIDKEDKNAINKGVICYGRKINQEKIGANQKNEMYNFQMEKIEQSIKDIQKYENVSDFNKEVYSRWNL